MLNYPHITSVEVDNGILVSFRYRLCVPGKRVYHARIEQASKFQPSNRLIIVKLVSSQHYNATAHYQMAQLGFAPKLYAMRPSGYKHWLVVVMEDVSHDKWARSNTELTEAHRVKELEAIRALHSMGWVHGDLRDGNVLNGIDSDGHARVCLLDFDWCQAVRWDAIRPV